MLVDAKDVNQDQHWSTRWPKSEAPRTNIIVDMLDGRGEDPEPSMACVPCSRTAVMVSTCLCDGPGVEGPRQRRVVDDAATRHVNDPRALLDLRERVVIEHLLRHTHRVVTLCGCTWPNMVPVKRAAMPFDSLEMRTTPPEGACSGWKSPHQVVRTGRTGGLRALTAWHAPLCPA